MSINSRKIDITRSCEEVSCSWEVSCTSHWFHGYLLIIRARGKIEIFDKCATNLCTTNFILWTFSFISQHISRIVDTFPQLITSSIKNSAARSSRSLNIYWIIANMCYRNFTVCFDSKGSKDCERIDRKRDDAQTRNFDGAIGAKSSATSSTTEEVKSRAEGWRQVKALSSPSLRPLSVSALINRNWRPREASHIARSVLRRASFLLVERRELHNHRPRPAGLFRCAQKSVDGISRRGIRRKLARKPDRCNRNVNAALPASFIDPRHSSIAILATSAQIERPSIS